MKVFVTGATGFIGSHVVRAHLKKGDQVRCLVRENSPNLALQGLEVEKVNASLLEPDSLLKAIDGCDAIQHVAGIFDPGPGGNKRMREVHVTGTSNLLKAAEKAQIGGFVLCSSSITMGWGTKESPADEFSPLPDADRVYGINTALRNYFETKLESEKLVLEACQRGLHAMIVNPDYVIGDWDIKPTSGSMILTIAKYGWIPVYPLGGKCFIDAADCGTGHVLALEKGLPGQRYLLGVQNLSYQEFMTKIAKVVKGHRPIFGLPKTATSILGLLGAAISRFDPHRGAGLDQKVLSTMQEPRYRTGKRAKEELGLPQTEIENSIEAAYKWFAKYGYI